MTRYCQTVAVLLTVLMTMVPFTRGQTAPQQDRRQRLMKLLDKDGDGKVSAAERAAATDLLARWRNRLADAQPPKTRTWKTAGLERTALVYEPSKKSDQVAPVVFGFHGHGGTAANAARTFGFQRLWPEAIVVYMQGVPTPGRLTDPDGKRNGWQHSMGVLGDRDLKFFDAVLATLKKDYQIDENRIYATGHSNGGAFTYLLWSARPDVFAAIAPSSAASASLRTSSPKPLPVMHVAGRNDPLVKFQWQERAMQMVRKINGCQSTGQQWAKDCTLYPSPQKHAPVVTLIHSGTHKYEAQAPPLIVRFFKEHKRQQ